MALNIKKYKKIRANITKGNRQTEIKGALEGKIVDLLSTSSKSNQDQKNRQRS